MAIAVGTNRRPMTPEEFERLPEGPPYYDYIDGEAIEVNKPTPRHQDIEHSITHVLKQHARSRGLGRVHHNVDVRLPQGNWVGPDILFLKTEHLGWIDEKGDLRGVPDLAVEITSPSTAAYDRVEKLAQYHLAGVPWVWIVDQETLQVEEHQWTPEGWALVSVTPAGGVFRPRLFPGLEISLQTLLES